MNKGLIFIMSGPSGTGKGTVCSELMKRREDLFLSVSATSRPIKAGETDGVTYTYVSADEFKNMIDSGEMLEWAVYNGNYYGTPKKAIHTQIENGRSVLLEIEPQGALNVKAVFPEANMIFIVPPSMEELKKRLIERGRETEEQILERLEASKWEFAQARKYDRIIVNDDLNVCVDEVMDYIDQKMKEDAVISALS